MPCEHLRHTMERIQCFEYVGTGLAPSSFFPRPRSFTSTITHNHSMWILNWLDVQPSPANLVSLDTLDGHSLYRELLSVGLRSMIMQFGPYCVSFFYLTEDIYLY